VYTGYAGYVNSQIFPSQVVKMESFNPSFFPKLLNKAPAPFERNQKRLDELVRTMRIRTTEPLLPELR
ncbi:hypothetical protein HNQ59_004003, partial [Chitinivorax tropicus]|nr:hypothetical protein [Chitinivorax tropicus]